MVAQAVRKEETTSDGGSTQCWRCVMMELLKCAQCGDRPGLLMSVVDRSAGVKINLCYSCYKAYARHVVDS